MQHFNLGYQLFFLLNLLIGSQCFAVYYIFCQRCFFCKFLCTGLSNLFCLFRCNAAFFHNIGQKLRCQNYRVFFQFCFLFYQII